MMVQIGIATANRLYAMITDYKPFLSVNKDGCIWWLREDAIRLGAGFYPVRDDHQNLNTKLRTSTPRALVDERTLIGAFGNDRLPIEQPMTFERDGFYYVEAEGFLNWLSKYIEQTQSKITFPEALAREVKMAKIKAATSKKSGTSQEFKSLKLALDGWFNKKLSDLPSDLRQRVEQDFVPNLWDNLSEDQRQRVAIQLDYQNDPETEKERKYWWNFFTRLHELEEQIAEWESAETPTASDIALRESRLKELREEKDRMELQKRQARGDYYPKNKPSDRAKREKATTSFIAYPKAMNILREKWQATPEELAIWIFHGPEMDGIAAFTNANELSPPPRFYFAYNVACKDYLAPLMYCWFRKEDIDLFEPADRYITGVELIKRWSNHPGLLPKPFIIAKIAESRLLYFHPTFGDTRGAFREQENFPPLKVGLFSMSQIERIESEDGFVSVSIVSNSETKPAAQNTPHDKGGRPQSPLTEAVEKAYLHFLDKGDVAILQPGNIRSFLKNFKLLANDEDLTVGLGNWNVSTYIAERIKEVKIPRAGKCSVVTQDRKERGKINQGKRYNQDAIAKKLTNLRKKYPLPS